MTQTLNGHDRVSVSPDALAEALSTPGISALLRERVVQDVLQSPHFGAKLFPTAGASSGYAVPRTQLSPRKTTGADFPVPSAEWLVNWGGEEVFVQGGRRDVGIMRELAADHGFHFAPGSHILEFGSSRGRMMRWLYDIADQCELWGVDLVAEDVTWSQQNLGPPVNYLTNTSYPHLPFEDRTFDFIYAGSVFTHMSDMADAWFLELRRLLKGKGYLYVTIHDNHSVDYLYDRGFATENLWWKRVMGEFSRVTAGKPLSEFQTVVVDRSIPSAEQVFYDREFLLAHWGRYMKVLGIREEAYSGFQTAILFEKG
jgi:ubiquinone/menaquinone biosynthesis C-methylase UbiE